MLHQYLSRKIRKEFISFLEKSVTSDEQKIASAIKEYVRDMNSLTHHHTHAYLAPDAKIDSPMLHQKNLGAEEIHRLRDRLHHLLVGVFFDNATIFIAAGGTAARVSGVMRYITKQSERAVRYTFQLVLIENRWLISEAGQYEL